MIGDIINKVEKKNIKIVNLEDYFPKEEILIFDLKPFLYKALILREKDFRDALKEVEWEMYRERIILVQCSVDSIIPIWAYLLVASYLHDIAYEVFVGEEREYLQMYYERYISNMSVDEYISERVIIHGCSNRPVPLSAFVSVTNRLQGIVKSLMFGDIGSKVPIYKKKSK